MDLEDPPLMSREVELYIKPHSLASLRAPLKSRAMLMAKWRYMWKPWTGKKTLYICIETISRVVNIMETCWCGAPKCCSNDLASCFPFTFSAFLQLLCPKWCQQGLFGVVSSVLSQTLFLCLLFLKALYSHCTCRVIITHRFHAVINSSDAELLNRLTVGRDPP